MPGQLFGYGRSDRSSKLIRGLESETPAGFRARRGFGHDPAPVTPDNALFFSRHTKRREFIALIGAAAAWPLAAPAQQAGKLPAIGFLVQSTRSASSEWVAAFLQRLRELGWIEGRMVAIEYRWTEGRADRAAQVAAEFVRLKVDIILTSGTPQVLAVKQATSVIPIVFATAGDPVANGLVASLARPGGNVTGLSLQSSELAGKRLGLLQEVVPSLGRLAILANVGNPFSVLEMGEVQAAARRLGLEVDTLEIRRAEDIASVFEALKGRRRHFTSASTRS